MGIKQENTQLTYPTDATVAKSSQKMAYNLESARLPTTGYARALKFMLIWRELGGMVQDVEFSLHTVIYNVIVTDMTNDVQHIER